MPKDNINKSVIKSQSVSANVLVDGAIYEIVHGKDRKEVNEKIRQLRSESLSLVVIPRQ